MPQLFKPEDEFNLAQKMEELYNCPELRHSLVEKSIYEYARINWDVMKRRYLDLVENIIKS